MSERDDEPSQLGGGMDAHPYTCVLGAYCHAPCARIADGRVEQADCVCGRSLSDNVTDRTGHPVPRMADRISTLEREVEQLREELEAAQIDEQAVQRAEYAESVATEMAERVAELESRIAERK